MQNSQKIYDELMATSRKYHQLNKVYQEAKIAENDAMELSLMQSLFEAWLKRFDNRTFLPKYPEVNKYRDYCNDWAWVGFQAGYNSGVNATKGSGR